eukprot:TRINITY_DN26552_c0_g1_i1.p1 TRINITY_DN26552_c0_g1~~TRINITY_DN26552_c0_g1_i1.p1  ORF type:complete len:140 (-),score=15.84 TRINITY_DN26552_c0_g1_i1:1286-1705(-)
MAASSCLQLGTGIGSFITSRSVNVESTRCRYSSSRGFSAKVAQNVRGESHGSRRNACKSLRTNALLNEGEGQSGDDPSKKKGISRDDEPEEFWQSEGERSGKNPMSTILPWVAILGILFPFIILGIAFANGYIKTPSGY